MNMTVDEILKQQVLSKEDVIALLQTDKEGRNKVFTHAAKIKAD